MNLYDLIIPHQTCEPKNSTNVLPYCDWSIFSGIPADPSISQSHNIWVFPKIVVPQNGWSIMIWGYPYFWKHPYQPNMFVLHCKQDKSFTETQHPDAQECQVPSGETPSNTGFFGSWGQEVWKMISVWAESGLFVKDSPKINMSLF